MTLSDKYRPSRLEDVIGQGKAVDILSRLPEYGGRAYYITGKSGTGKTTIAKILAFEVADCNEGITETTGRELTVNVLREWYTNTIKGTMLFGGYALIVNESHGLCSPVVELLLNYLEALPTWATILFTTTRGGDNHFNNMLDAAAFRSRCVCLALAPVRGMKQKQGNYIPEMAAFLHEIATKEGLNGKPVSAYERLLDSRHCDGNAREALNFIEQGKMLE